MKLPDSFLNSLQNLNGFDRNSFIRAHEQPEQLTSIRINPFKIDKPDSSENDVMNRTLFFPDGKVSWCKNGFYLKQRPSFTFDPLFHAGCYYVQEASSMFLEEIFIQLIDPGQTIKVLDACAAPGGKSTHILSLISKESILVANEVIRSRSQILSDNIIKWGCANAIVTNNDPSAFKKIPGYFDVIVVDAPCSGSGLFRRDEEALNEWSLNNVQLCCQRQQRILADILPALKEDGLLIYSTCSYSKEEDEDILAWLVTNMEMQNVRLNIPDEWNIVKSSIGNFGEAYRFYPDRLKGEGFFISCFRKKKTTNERFKNKERKVDKIPQVNASVIKEWLNADQLELVDANGKYFAGTYNLIKEYSFLKSALNCIYNGIEIGQVLKNKLVPSHALALCNYLKAESPLLQLDYENSIKYLQRQEIKVSTQTKGWHVVSYNKYPIGWVNILNNRINNYYPKQLRILKQTVKS
ncbi:MAG: methyltransferase RsmF C-terminal domain-like protein [Flavisolibacter sp.]